MNKRKDLNKSIKISLLVAIAVVLMYFDFPIVPIFPWLKIDFSEVPALIGGFAYGPIVGGIIVVLKVILRFLLKGSATFGVGEIANILVGVALVMPAAWLYNRNKSTSFQLCFYSSQLIIISNKFQITTVICFVTFCKFKQFFF